VIESLKKARPKTKRNSYEDKIRKSIDGPADAVWWAQAFLGDREEMKEFIVGGKWAVKWAKHVGDEEEMKSRLSHVYWKKMFNVEVNGVDETFR